MIVADCVKVTGVDNFPQANGVYHYDASTEECNDAKSGYPTYKHAAQEVYLWYHFFKLDWFGSTISCDEAWTSTLFGTFNTLVYSPDLVTADGWRMTNMARDNVVPHPALNVTTCSCKILLSISHLIVVASRENTKIMVHVVMYCIQYCINVYDDYNSFTLNLHSIHVIHKTCRINYFATFLYKCYYVLL